MGLKIGKRNIIIISVVLAVIIIATAITVPLVVLSKNGTIVFEAIEVPQIQVYDVKAEPDYTVTLGWNEVLGAVGYKLEYYYEADVKDVNSVTAEEISTANINALTYTFPRQKGNLYFRICACASEEKYDSGYSEWACYNVQAISFALPTSFELAYFTLNGYSCYKATESTRSAWKPVTYTYMGVTKTVNFYEVRTATPENSDKVPEEQGIIYNKSALLSNEYYFPTAGVWTLYIRAVSYGELNGIRVDKFVEAPELYTLFGETDEWTKIEVTVAE